MSVPSFLLRLRALGAVAAAAAALRILRFPAARRILAGRGAAGDPSEVLRAVDSAARFVPGATCLARSLAARSLGHPSRVLLGVSREGGFSAHAWIEGTDGGAHLPVAVL